MRAYSEMYLQDAMENLGVAFDYANDCGIAPQQFFNIFIASGIAEQFDRGNTKYIQGYSGVELLTIIISNLNLPIMLLKPTEKYNYSNIYWLGYMLAYYQWYTGIPFRKLWNVISIDEILSLYSTLHEAPLEKFVDVVGTIIAQGKRITNLQMFRKLSKLSQRELSEKSGINLRTIQQYEIRDKDINKASASTLVALSKSLNCTIEDLLEIVAS